jgi:hypothetical protein
MSTKLNSVCEEVTTEEKCDGFLREAKREREREEEEEVDWRRRGKNNVRNSHLYSEGILSRHHCRLDNPRLHAVTPLGTKYAIEVWVDGWV